MRRLRVVVAAVAVGCGALAAAPTGAHGALPRGSDRCDEYQALSDDLADLELNKEFDAEGYADLADDYADAAKDAPAELRQALKTSAKFYAKVARSKSEKAAIKRYIAGLQKYADEFAALDTYLVDHCGATPKPAG